mgnify:FL=1
MPKMPHALTGFLAYKYGKQLIGTVNVELPKLEQLTETIQGAGIAGEIEAVIKGQFKAMSATIETRTVTDDSFSLLDPNGIDLTFRGNIQAGDSSTGRLTDTALKVRIKAQSKVFDIGKLEAGKAMGTKNEFSVSYYKVWFDNEEHLEVDIPNYIFKIGGIDYLAGVRKNLGL